MKQRVLVLGGSGFIGRHVVAALAASGWAEPVVGSRRAAAAATATAAAAGARAGSIRIDATDAGQLREALAGMDAVVNCVAGGAETIVANARALFSAAAAHGRLRVVHLSSMAVYGDVEGDVAEGDVGDAVRSPYGAAKLEAERLAPPELPLVIFRPGIVYGPGSDQWSVRIGRLLRAHRLGDLGAAGDGWCNLVYVDDVVAAILTALQRPAGGRQIFNLSLPEPPTWNEYFLRYAKSLRAVPVARIGARRLKIESKLLAPPLKIAELVAGRVSRGLQAALPQPMSGSLVRGFGQRIRLDVSAVERALALRWTALEDGLQRTAAWLRLEAA